jgi:hypothetical protein
VGCGNGDVAAGGAGEMWHPLLELPNYCAVSVLYAFDLLELDGADLRPMLVRSNSG